MAKNHTTVVMRHAVEGAWLIVLMLAVLAAFASGCSGNGVSSGASATSSSSSGIAATVNEYAITEDEVTAYIDSYRAGVSCTDDKSWAEHLADRGISAEELRKMTIYELAAPLIYQAKAAELGITVDENAVDAEIAALRSSLLVEDDASWESELARYGMTEEKLRENMSQKNLESQVLDQVAADVVATDDECARYAATSLAGTKTKKIACVYGANYDNVQAALTMVQGAASVAEGMGAIKASPEAWGVQYADVGWDLDAELTSGMANVVSYLGNGEVASAPLGEGGYYYVFYIEDEYTFPADETAVDLSDESLKKSVSTLASASLKEAAGADWLQRQFDGCVVVRDMPEGLSYDVDVEAYASGASGSAG